MQRQLARLRREAGRREFVEKLVEKARTITVGDPTERENWMGPVINERALDTFQRAVDDAKADGGTVEIGGEVLRGSDTERGFFPTPTVVTGLPLEHRLFRDELFVPFLVVGEVDSLDAGARGGQRQRRTA